MSALPWLGFVRRIRSPQRFSGWMDGMTVAANGLIKILCQNRFILSSAEFAWFDKLLRVNWIGWRRREHPHEIQRYAQKPLAKWKFLVAEPTTMIILGLDFFTSQRRITFFSDSNKSNEIFILNGIVDNTPRWFVGDSICPGRNSNLQGHDTQQNYQRLGRRIKSGNWIRLEGELN